MSDIPRLAVQEQLVPGASLQQKFDVVQRLGFDGIEVRSAGKFAFRGRLKELTRATADGVVISSACMDMREFIADLDPGHRREARENLKSQLGVIAAVGGAGVVAPATYGVASKRLPPYTSPRPESEDARIVVEALTEIGHAAEREGVQLFLEPLNRYEDFIINRLEQGADLIERSGTTGASLCADLWHMSIEEDDPAQALLHNASRVGHVHLSGSNRNEPGTGHTDWVAITAALRAVRYSGWMVLECRPRVDGEQAMKQTRETVLRAFATAEFVGDGLPCPQ